MTEFAPRGVFNGRDGNLYCNGSQQLKEPLVEPIQIGGVKIDVFIGQRVTHQVSVTCPQATIGGGLCGPTGAICEFAGNSPIVEREGFILDKETGELSHNDKSTTLSSTAKTVLEILMLNSGRQVPTSVLQEVAGGIGLSTLRNHISDIRGGLAKIGDRNKKRIQTVRGGGYKFGKPATPQRSYELIKR